MGTFKFNPVSFVTNLVIGWFFMSLLQSAMRSLFVGNWKGLVPRFQDIAFFHDGRAAFINILIILTIGVLANGLWFLFHRG